MALSLGVSRGEKITIGAGTLEVTNVIDYARIEVLFNNDSHLVTDQERVELMEGVFVSCGAPKGKKHDSYARLAFEAPKSILINRVGHESN